MKPILFNSRNKFVWPLSKSQEPACIQDREKVNLLKQFLLIFLIAISSLSTGQTLTQTGFTGVTVPQYMSSGTATRMPVMFRATVTGLTPNTPYRYFINGAISTDLGSTNPGAGNPLMINAAGTSYTYSSGASLTSAGNYETFTTDASGNYTGWFGFVNTGNARFTAGNIVYPTIVIGSNTGTTLHRRALDLTMTVLGFATTAGASNGSFVRSTSSATAKNIAVVYSNAAGTGRPLSSTVIESIGVAIPSVPAAYTTSAGTWNVIVPNNNASGIQRIEQRNIISNVLAGCAVDADGIWPTGSVNTINPVNGTTALVINGADALLTSCGGTPLIAVSGTLSSVNTTYGTASISPTSYTVSGSDLSANILITAPSGFEISQTPGGASGYATTQTLTQSGGSIPSTTIYVRIAATTFAGNYSGNITHSSGAANANIATVLSTVSPKALTVANASANNKVYDRATSATISGATAVGTVNSDVITINGGGTFADFNVGISKPVTAALTISGTNSSSYTLTQPTGLSADITAKDLMITDASITNKVYDGNTEASLTGTLSGVISPDDVTINLSASFDSSFVETAIPVTSTSTLSGADVSNYNLVQPVGLSADILVKQLTIINPIALNKVFDGNTDAIITGTLSGVVSPDDVTLVGTGFFAQSSVGNNIPVTSTSTIVGDISNYTLVQPTGLTANISSQALQPQTISFDPLANAIYGDSPITLTATASSGLTVTYTSSDTAVATVSGNILTIVGVGTTDITASQSGDGTYDSASQVVQPFTVSVKELTANAIVVDKVYDGNTIASLTGTLIGIVGSDDVTFIGSGIYSDDIAGLGISVTSTSTLGGSDAANYSLTQPSGLTGNITPKELSITGAVADNKIYDGTTAATVSGATLNGVVGSDDVSVINGGTFASEDVANGIAVIAGMTLTGADAFNYSVAQPTGLSANITPASVSVSGITGGNKVYDATTTASVSGTTTLTGIIGADDVSVSGSPTAVFANKNVGLAKPITVTGYTLAGADAGNYNISSPTGVTGDITPASLTIFAAAAQDKLFDETTAAIITGTLTGVLGTDVVSLIGTGTFASSAVGTGIAVTSTSTVGGADGLNYVINPQPAGLTANITPAPTVLANWTYEPLQGAISGPTANIGSGTSSLVGSMLVANPGTATGMNTPTGCGAQTSSTLAWAISTANPGTVNESSGARFNTNTTGYENIRFTWEQRWSNTSANTVRVQYTIDGTSWSNFTMTSGNTTFCLGSINNGRFEANTTGDQFRRISVDMSSVSGVSNNPLFGVRVLAAHYQATGQFRQVSTPAAVATAGTWRFDNVKFTGTDIPVTPPTSSVIAGDATICQGDSTNITVSITGGTSPFSIVYSDGTNNITVNNYFSGTLISTSPTNSTTYTLVSVTDANALVGTGNSGSAIITVNNPANYYADADGDGFGNNTMTYFGCAQAGYVLDNTDCNDSIAAINPGMTELLYNGIDDNCNGQLDEGFQITTQVVASQCGITLNAINSLISATNKPNATAYRFEVTDTSTGAIQTIIRNVQYFSLSMLATYDYATTYSIRVEIQRNNVWLGYYGNPCLVSTPAILAPGGAAQVTPSQCGITLTNISTLIATTSLQGATGYRFRITNVTDSTVPNQVQVIDRSLHWFNLPMLATYNYGTTYLVEIAVKTTGAYSAYGNPCSITAPTVPMLMNCGATLASSNTLIYTTSLAKVTSYRFEVTNLNDNVVTTIDRPVHYFSFNNIPGYQPSTQYGVRVALMTSGVYSTFSDACEISSPGNARHEEPNVEPLSAIDFEAIAYPNPFTSNFLVDIHSSSRAYVIIQVYDMTGRLLNAINTGVSDLNLVSIGDNYPSGVYNVIVSQGDEVKILRVIKR